METLKTNLYNKIYHDYLNDVPAIQAFLPPVSQKDLTKIAPHPGSDPAHYHKIKTIVAEQNKDLNSEQAKIYLRYLEDPNTLIIITGQQLGLFASPLYTIYKLMTTIRLAESLNSQKGKYHYVPMFWLETEDHDFQEINHTGIFDREFQPVKIMYNGKDREKVSIRHYQIDNSADEMIDRLKENMLDTEFSADLIADLRNYFQVGTDWSRAVRSFLKELFAPFGLLFFEPGAEKIKEKSIPFFKQILEENEKVASLFTNTSNQMELAGYHNQVKVIPGQTYVHIENDDLQRGHLYRRDNMYGFKDTDRYFSLDEVLKRIENNPLSVSTTVISRPLLQSWLLPVAAYVAGPGEIAYWAQLGTLFDHFDLDFPYLSPRISATIVEPKIKRYLTKYGISANHLRPGKKEFINQHYIDSNQGTNDPLKNLQKILNEEEKQILDYIRSIDQTLLEGGKKTIERMAQTLSNFENRVLKAQKEKDALKTGHLEQIHAAFFPEDVPQERYIGIVYYLNKFGPDFINYLYENLDSSTFDHQILYR